MIDLDIKKAHALDKVTNIKRAHPFIRNKWAKLIHRPRYAKIHHGLESLGRKPHISINCYCGAGFAGDVDRLVFEDKLADKDVVCKRCEEAAVKSGLPSSSELKGSHACVGGLEVKACHKLV